MGIRHDVGAEPLAEEEFGSLDYKVTGLAFDIHRDFGPLCDEAIYQAELAHRCKEAGIAHVRTEAPIHVEYRTFRKTYYVDMLVGNAMLYELKTVRALTSEHRMQALNYLLLTGLRHAKLINLRPPSVELRFVSTRLTPQKRFAYTADDSQWQDLDDDGAWLRALMLALLAEWGAFLDTALFYDAIEHFRGGHENVAKQIEMVAGARSIATQRAHLLNPATALRISSVTQDPSSYEHHLRRFLSHTHLRAIQWINFNHHTILLKTLLR